MALEALPQLSPHAAQPDLPEIPVSQTEQRVASVDDVCLPERRQQGSSRIARAATVAINDTNAAMLVNLGQGGMRVQALGCPLEPGANLRLQFQLPGSPELICISGAVAWVNDTAEAGIRFAGLSTRLMRRLHEWTARNGIANAAREFMSIAGSWQPALDLMAELTRMLTGARGVALRLTDQRPIFSSVDDDLPVRTTVAAPIYAGRRIIGHLEISSPELGAFDERDLSALPVLAALTGGMVELRAAALREPAPKTPRLSARIASRIESMIPTIRVRLTH